MIDFDNKEFIARVLGSAPERYAPDRLPLVFYEEAGDCVEIYQSDEPFNAERIDGRVTVFRGKESKSVVGAQIKGIETWISRILEQFPGFKLDVVDNCGKYRVSLLFQFESWKTADKHLSMQYRELVTIASNWRVQSSDLSAQSQNSSSFSTSSKN